MMEYFGSKIDIVCDNTGLGTAKFSQPVLVQKLATEFEMDLGTGTTPQTPAIAGDGNPPLPRDKAKNFRSGTAIVMYLMQWPT